MDTTSSLNQQHSASAGKCKMINKKITRNDIKKITYTARFDRLLNCMQSNNDGCVDEKTFVDIATLRNVLYWDIVEYIEKREYGTTIKDREKKMVIPKGNEMPFIKKVV